MNFSTIAQQYREACQAVKAAIKSSPYKAAWFQRQLGYASSPDAYYKRLNTGNWEPEHLSKIAQLLEGRAVITD